MPSRVFSAFPFPGLSKKSRCSHLSFGLFGMNSSQARCGDLGPVSFRKLHPLTRNGYFCAPFSAEGRAFLPFVDQCRRRRCLRGTDAFSKTSQSDLLMRGFRCSRRPTVSSVRDVGQRTAPFSQGLNPEPFGLSQSISNGTVVQDGHFVNKTEGKKFPDPIVFMGSPLKRTRGFVLFGAIQPTRGFSYIPDFAGSRIDQCINEVLVHG